MGNKERKEIVEKDLATAETVGFFDMRVEEYKELTGGHLPLNHKEMRRATIERNIVRVKGEIATANTEGFRKMMEEKIVDLKRE